MVKICVPKVRKYAACKGVKRFKYKDALRAMVDSDQTSQNISCFDSDWNSNQFLTPDAKQTDQKSLDGSFFEQYSNIKDNANKDYYRKSSSSPGGSPTSAYGGVLHQKDLSYDDLSKNIDANLAEIDMETFRSEDINSILALPAIFSGGDFQTAGEQCASVSGSLLGGAMLELDASARSNRHSEDEISIIKDEPLFSPLREPPAQATISVDSLDNSSSYEQDLVLTCKANKNNYTIVFEGSSTQFSDDSDYQDHLCSNNSSSSNQSGGGGMAQSDVAFTTWSKLWKSHRVVSNRRKNSESSKMTSSKSQSLPNLSHSSVLITDKQLSQWAKWCGHHQFPLYELVKMGATNKEGQQLHSISLLKLFMKHKVGGSSSIGSSTADSASSTSLIMQPLNYRNAVLQNSSSMSVDDNETTTRTALDNEANNNNNLLNSLYNNATETTTTAAVVDNNNVTETECDNSQYFEDSLMDAPSPPLKHFHATPIKEEEETDISSGDEVMRDSKNPFGSDESSSGEITVINNEAAAAPAPPPKSSNLEQRISNIFPLKKPTTTTTESHATQTRQYNINECTGGAEAFKPFSSCKTSSNQTDCDTPVTYTPSRDSSPASSGYVSSRHSSVERLRHSSSGNVFTHNNATPQKNSSNVVLTTTCTCGTQIPVHVKDSSMQTSGLASSTSSGFTLKESTSALPEPNNVSQQTSYTRLSSHSNTSSQTGKPRSPKGNKSIYVCYPNYSLPDLSFLKSVIEENSESVFLAPTEYRLPQDMTPKRPSRPKSYTAYESMLQKHLTKIKDFESLNVLLPDDLKLLISKTKGGAVPKAQQQQQQCMSSSFDGKQQHVPRSILRKSSSAEQQQHHQCEDGSRRCSSASDECKLLEGGFSKKVVESILPSFEAPRACEVEEGGKKAVKFCERSPTKSSKQLDAACKSGRCCSCDNQNKTPESEKPPQEFLVSPTQNALIYPDISDSYTLQNFSGGGKFFQEALRRKTGLVENLRKAVQIIFEHHKNSNKKGMELSYSLGQKILTCLCPAVHTILSDGLLPSVQGFFGPLPNSPWKVAGASIKQGETRKDVEELLNHVTAEKLLTDSTYRFNAFILGLLNLGCFEWWLGHLCACQSLICHHYHPTALLSLLALPAAVHLRHELKELVSPLSNLPFHHLDILLETKSTSEHWKKYDEGNFRPELNFLQCTPCGRGKINDLCGVKSKVLLASPCSNVMNIHEEENQVWPGITINPFPNAEFCGVKKERNNQTTTKPSPLRDTLLPRGDDPGSARRATAADTPLFSLCSSTDSGCSSQIQEHIANIANLNLTEEDKPEAKEFKMLRQKWEKMTTAKAPPKSAPLPSAAKPTISSTSKTKKRQEGLSAPKTPTKTPPSRRAQGGRFEPPKPLSSPEATPSDEKRRSGIPMLKFGKPKSMIPTVQKPGLSRARSANRDARYPSD